MSKLIVDISSHQETVNFKRMKEAGVKAVLIRAGYRGAKTGKIGTDPRYTENVRNAEKVELPIGLYWYTTSLSVKEAEEEADACVKLAQGHKLSFPIWLDLEFYNSKREGRADHLSAKSRTEYAVAFLEHVKKLGYEAGVYCNPDFWRHDLQPEKLEHYPRWIAHYGGKSAGMDCDIWQFTSTASGKKYGVGSSHIDLNEMYTDFTAGAKSKFATDTNVARKSATGNPYPEPKKIVTSDAQAKAKGVKTYISTGDGVRHIQYELHRLGYDLGPSGVDGKAGKMTVAAITLAQEEFKITVDGLGGKETLSALHSAKQRPQKKAAAKTTATTKKQEHIATVDGKKITIDGKTLKVFNQHKLSGKYDKNLSSNGCGASCTVFALTLRGEEIAPAELLDKAISLWGKWPRACLLSAPGVASIIKEYGYPAKYHSVTSDNRDSIKGKIDAALKAGKQVVCWTNDNGKKGDPFAKGQHYVMAVGYNKAGKVVVANSGNKGPVNVVDLSTLVKFLQNGSGEDKHWWKRVSHSAGIVVVG